MLTEEDWAVLESCPPYEKSKLLAEQSAWDFVKKLPGMVYWNNVESLRCRKSKAQT